MEREEAVEQAVKAGFYQAEVDAGEWVVPERYQGLKPLGIGTFGTV